MEDTIEIIESIKHAAVITTDGWPIFGKTHAECFGKGFYIGIKLSPKAIDQGFITSFGRYVDRSDAAIIAVKSGQLDKCDFLFSEYLWDIDNNGKYDYDTIEGYVLKKGL